MYHKLDIKILEDKKFVVLDFTTNLAMYYFAKNILTFSYNRKVSYLELFPYDTMNGARFTKNNTDRKSTRLNSSHHRISYAVFCLKKKNQAGLRRDAVQPDIEAERKKRDEIDFFFNDTATTEIYTLSLHDALPIS